MSQKAHPVKVYVDGRGGEHSGYGYVVPATGDSFYAEETGLTNNQAEYTAILAALQRYEGTGAITIYSDSQVVVSQIDHRYAIKNDALRILARQVWQMMQQYESVQVRWVRRQDNPAGKMLG